MSTAQPWTIGRLLQWTSDYLKQHGSSSPRLDAEVLLAETLGRTRIELYTRFDTDPGDEARATFRELVRRRAAGEPVAYLVGHREFYSLAFAVSPDVLIPRPETEFVVLALLDAIRDYPAGEQPLEIADVGTGSGVIAICAAKHVAACRVTAIDSSPAALEVARRNAEAHEVAGRIEFVLSDLCTSLPPDRGFDFMVSNPPYLSEREFEQAPADVRNYEPRSALVAGPAGEEVIARLVPQAADRLAPGGSFITEISPMLEGRVLALLRAEERFETAATKKDLAGLARVVSARRREFP
jgi:release factor glutamine methyltransferase